MTPWGLFGRRTLARQAAVMVQPEVTADDWPDPYGPDPYVFGDVAAVRNVPEVIG